MPRISTIGSRLKTIDTRKVRAPTGSQNPIYQAPAYRRWRAAVIRRAGGACQDTQHDPLRPRSGIRLYADHIVELRDGGEPFDVNNGMARCGACHTRKTIAARAERMGGG